MTEKNTPDLSREGPFARILGNFALLLRGRWLAGVLTFAATTMMARTLGAEGFGLVMLMHAYVLLIRGLVNVQPFEAVVRFGVPLTESGDLAQLQRLLAVCARVDRQSVWWAATLGLTAAPLAVWMLHLNSSQGVMLALYSLTNLVTGNGTAIGILRLYDRFDLIGNQMLVSASVRLLGVTSAVLVGAPVVAFVASWAVAYLADNIYVSRHGWREYRQRWGTQPTGRGPEQPKLSEFVGLRNFLWVTYAQSSIDLAPKHLATILAGHLLGPGGAGLFRLAREYASLLIKPVDLIRQVLFLDLTRSWHQRSSHFLHITWRTTLLAGSIGLVVTGVGLLVGAPLIKLLAGAPFVAATPVLVWLLLAASMNLAEAPLRAAAYAMGLARAALRLHTIATALYLVLFVGLAHLFGLPGTGIATAITAAIAPLGMAMLIKQGAAAGSTR